MTDLASEPVDSVKGVWYDITVAWDGAELTVSRGLSGGALTELFTAETTLENVSTDIGFGVGEKAEYRFDEVRLSSPSLSAEEPSKLTEYIYDALGRRVAMTDYTGASARTTRYPPTADERIIEELDADNNLRASYVYGKDAEGLAGDGWMKSPRRAAMATWERDTVIDKRGKWV